MVGIADPAPASAAISASFERRHAPARHDRDGALVRAEAHHRGRADHRARRDDPGADPGADEGPDAAPGRRADHHHAQSRRRGALRRPGERHVCGPHRRERLGAPASITARAIPTRSRCCARSRAWTSRARPSSIRSRGSRPTSCGSMPAVRSGRAAASPLRAATRPPPCSKPMAGGHLSACWEKARLAELRQAS